MYKIAPYVTVSFFIFILWGIYMANMGQHTVLFDLLESIPNGDKMVHCFLFGLLTFGINVASKFRCVTLFSNHVLFGTFFVSVFTVTEEFSQLFFPTRTADVLDLCADAIGVIVFTLLSCYVRSRTVVI